MCDSVAALLVLSSDIESAQPKPSELIPLLFTHKQHTENTHTHKRQCCGETGQLSMTGAEPKKREGGGGLKK